MLLRLAEWRLIVTKNSLMAPAALCMLAVMSLFVLWLMPSTHPFPVKNIIVWA